MPEPRAAAAWLLEGHGKRPKVGIGSLDCPAQVFLDILGRDRATQGYTTATRIAFGGVAIEEKLIPGDHSYTGAGGTFEFRAQRNAPRTQPTHRLTHGHVAATTTWRVNTPNGCMIFVAPHPIAETAADVCNDDPGYVLEAAAKKHSAARASYSKSTPGYSRPRRTSSRPT